MVNAPSLRLAVVLLALFTLCGCDSKAASENKTQETTPTAPAPPPLRSTLLPSLKADLPLWTADLQRTQTRAMDAKAALAKGNASYDEKSCAAYDRWRKAIESEKDRFEKGRLEEEGREAVDRKCTEEVAALAEDLPSYARLKLRVTPQGGNPEYSFKHKGFFARIDDEDFDLDFIADLPEKQVIVTPDGSYGNIHRCEIGTGGGLFLYRPIAGEEDPYDLAPSSAQGMDAFIRVLDESKARAIAERLQRKRSHWPVRS